MIRVGIIGASGYGGAELLRIFANHPQVEVVYATSNEFAGQPLHAAHANLRGIYNLQFTATPTAATVDALPVVETTFLALPHGHALQLAPALATKTHIIDLSGDFRLRDGAVFEKFYGNKHTQPALQKQFAYGLSEVTRGKIREAKHIANPGCFATAILLGLVPLADKDLLSGPVIVDAKTGSSGSGAKAGTGTHHPDRSDSFYAYKPFAHQHTPEITQLLNDVSGANDWQDRLIFQTHSAPMVRGIFASIYCQLKEARSVDDLRAVYAERYGASPFIRLVDGSPNVKWVAHSNYVDIGFATNGQTAMIFVAIDNLLKGAAGQAVQNFNLMFGIEETTGLRLLASHP